MSDDDRKPDDFSDFALWRLPRDNLILGGFFLFLASGLSWLILLAAFRILPTH